MRFLNVLAALSSIMLVSAASAKHPSNVSWAKSEVPFDQYTLDAAQCADTSRYVTTYIKPETLTKLEALSSADLLQKIMRLNTSNSMQVLGNLTQLHSANDIARRSNTFSSKYAALVSFDVRDQLQAVLGKCLIERGYVMVKLTPAQVKKLHTYKRHSGERTAYLHSIGSDPKVVVEQIVDPDQS